MAILDLPAAIPAPSECQWALVSATQSFSSPLSGAVQTLELPGARWSARLRWEWLTRAEAAALRAFLASLRGAAGRFRLWDHGAQTPRGSAAGVPVVAAGSAGATLQTTGWTPSAAGVLLAGDYVGLATGQLCLVVADANASAGGAAALSVEPPLRTVPATGSALVLTRPSAVMRLAGDDQARWDWRPAGLVRDMSIDCVETF